MEGDCGCVVDEDVEASELDDGRFHCGADRIFVPDVDDAGKSFPASGLDLLSSRVDRPWR